MLLSVAVSLADVSLADVSLAVVSLAVVSVKLLMPGSGSFVVGSGFAEQSLNTQQGSNSIVSMIDFIAFSSSAWVSASKKFCCPFEPHEAMLVSWAWAWAEPRLSPKPIT